MINEGNLLVSWFSNHHLSLAILRSRVMNKFGKTMALIKAAATRFGTNTLVGARLLELNEGLSAGHCRRRAVCAAELQGCAG